MPSLLVLPKQLALSAGGIAVPGAKLYTYATGTSTPQNTYQDIGLTTPHANPIVADSAGFFAPIYFDASLPNYRLKLTTSADVQIWQLDDIPSNQNTAQQFRLKYTAPELLFEETDASSNNKKWRIRADGEQLLIDVGDDAEATWNNVAALTRSGTTPVALNFAGQYLQVGGKLTATQESGSFTATLSGFTTTVTGTVKWFRSGTKIGLFVPSIISGTSNATSMGMTGMPSSILMGTNAAVVLCRVIDNGTTQLGVAVINRTTDGPPGISFGVGAVQPIGAFTNSGTKGLPTGMYIEWDSDAAGIA